MIRHPPPKNLWSPIWAKPLSIGSLHTSESIKDGPSPICDHDLKKYFLAPVPLPYLPMIFGGIVRSINFKIKGKFTKWRILTDLHQRAPMSRSTSWPSRSSLNLLNQRLHIANDAFKAKSRLTTKAMMTSYQMILCLRMMPKVQLHLKSCSHRTSLTSCTK